MIPALIILLILFIIACVAVAILIPRMMRMQEIIDEHFSNKDQRVEEIYSIMAEYAEHIKSIAGLDMYREDGNLSKLAEHSQYVVNFIESIDNEASYRWEDWGNVEKRLEKPITVAQVSSVPSREKENAVQE